MSLLKINDYYVCRTDNRDIYEQLKRIMKNVYGEVKIEDIEMELYFESEEVTQYDVSYLGVQIAIVSIFPDSVEKQVVINYQPI